MATECPDLSAGYNNSVDFFEAGTGNEETKSKFVSPDHGYRSCCLRIFQRQESMNLNRLVQEQPGIDKPSF